MARMELLLKRMPLSRAPEAYRIGVRGESYFIHCSLSKLHLTTPLHGFLVRFVGGKHSNGEIAGKHSGSGISGGGVDVGGCGCGGGQAAAMAVATWP